LVARIVGSLSFFKIMKNITRIGIAGAAMLSPLMAFAADFSTSTASTQSANYINDVKSVIGDNMPLILGLVAALAALAWVVRKFSKHVTGKKF